MKLSNDDKKEKAPGRYSCSGLCYFKEYYYHG